MPGGPRSDRDLDWTQCHTVWHCVTLCDTVWHNLNLSWQRPKAFLRPSLSCDRDWCQVTRSMERDWIKALLQDYKDRHTKGVLRLLHGNFSGASLKGRYQDCQTNTLYCGNSWSTQMQIAYFGFLPFSKQRDLRPHFCFNWGGLRIQLQMTKKYSKHI